MSSNVPEPVVYYACTTESNCAGTTVPLADQVPNPVTLFATDNNGTIITLPSVADRRRARRSRGSLIFGIDTESNNASGTRDRGTDRRRRGYLTTIFNGNTLTESFIDSGSNGYLLHGLESVRLHRSRASRDFYCPVEHDELERARCSSPAARRRVDFDVGNAEQIDASFYAFPGLGGTNPTPNSFDWGLPFFFGRRVATAIQGYTTSAGTGPYVAF